MAEATASFTTAGTDVNVFWRKIQGEAREALEFESEEYAMIDDLTAPEGTAWSAREVTIPIDIIEGAGIASIPEFGTEAMPSSPNLREITITMVHLNGRFNASKLAQWGDKGRESQVKRQINQQALSKARALAADFSDRFYGPSTGYLATTTTNATQSSGTYTLATGYGVAGITNAAYIAAKFKVGDRVALVRSGALVANAIGTITAVTAATPSIAVTWAGSVDSDAGDFVVKANSMENTTLSGGTDYNKSLNGLIDITTASSLHSLATSTEANWAAAYSDTSSGRFSFTKLQRMKDEIKDGGGAKLNTLITSRGVMRDATANERSVLRVSDPLGLTLDGDLKAKGVKIFASRRVPPGYVFGFDRSHLRKWSLLPKPDQSVSWNDGKEYINQAGYVFGMDLPIQLVCDNRKAFAYLTSQTEQ
jgi:hypothetical protein